MNMIDRINKRTFYPRGVAMKISIRFCCLFLFAVFVLVLSACTVNVTMVPQAENNSFPDPIASATHVIQVTAIATVGPTEAPPVTQNPLPFIKPADADTPAAGICGSGAGEIVQIQLGTGSDGLPLGGRCVQVTPLQRIELVNLTLESFHMTFGMFDVEVPSGGMVLLDKPAGEYLAPGVHDLPNGPALWLKTADDVPIETPGSFRTYSNSEVGYSLIFPSNWNMDDFGATSTNKEVIFYPNNPEPFIAYLDISLEFRSLDQIANLYAQSVPEAVRSNTVFNGWPAVQYTYSYGRIEYLIPYSDRIFRVSTDRPSNSEVQLILKSIRFMPATLTRYTNQELGYFLILPSNWNVDEHETLAGPAAETIFSPSNAEPFVDYLSILLDSRSMDQIINLYAQNVPEAVRSDTVFNGWQAVQFTYSYGRIEYYIPRTNQIILVTTDRPTDENVQKMIDSLVLIP